MKFSNTLEASMLPQWQYHYIDYKALKKLLKQAKSEKDHGLDFLTASPQTASLSVARSLATAAAVAAAHSPSSPSAMQQQRRRFGSSSSIDVSQAAEDVAKDTAAAAAAAAAAGPPFLSLVPSGSAQEQFLQLLQHELAKVRAFIEDTASQLSSDLEVLAAAAPRLAAAAWQSLEAQARDLGQQLLALEGFMQLNQAGFCKIVKKHDKGFPESPLWHLYLHHVLRSPWLEEQQQQYLWAALSSCYYHLHASMVPMHGKMRSSSSSSKRRQQQQQQGAGSKGVGGILPSLGSVVSAAAAGAATAVAAAAARSPAMAAAAAPTITVPETFSSSDTVKTTKKFWVAQENVSAVMYRILQHLPLLPSAAGSSSSSNSLQQQQQQRMYSAHDPPLQKSSMHDNAPQQQQQQRQRQRHRQLPQLSGFTTTMHTAYFDNKALELYHGRLYLRPMTHIIKARWISRDDLGFSINIGDGTRGNSYSVYPDKVVIERKIYKEGWKGEKNIKDALLIDGNKLPAYLVGAYSLSDALQQLYQLPALRQQFLQQQQQQQQCKQQSPFAAYANASLNGEQQQQQQQYVDSAAAAAAGIRVPAGVVLGASSSSSSIHGISISSRLEHSSIVTPSADEGRDLTMSEEHNKEVTGTIRGVGLPPAAAAASSSAPWQQQQQQQQSDASGSDDEIGFEDEYLDPPVPSADQLSLFTEVQRLVASKGLRPVLHCEVQRMVFAMPFDDDIKITLDTDVAMSAVDYTDDLLYGRHPFCFSSFTDQRSAIAPAAGANTSSSGAAADVAQLYPRPPIPPATSGGSFNAPSPRVTAAMASAEAAAYRTWDDIFQSGHSSSMKGSYSHMSSSSPVIGSPRLRYASTHGKIVYGLPYALLKISVNLPAGQSTIPEWLQQLMDSEDLMPVEDWSKYVHGCAVLLPDTVRAVPYWIDDELVDMSVRNIQAELDAEMDRREEAQRAALLSSSRLSVSSGTAAAAAATEQQQQGGTSAISILSRISSSVNNLLPGASLPSVTHTASFGRRFNSEGGGLGPGFLGRNLSLGSTGRSPSASPRHLSTLGSSSSSKRLLHSSPGSLPFEGQQQQYLAAAGHDDTLPVSLHTGSKGVTWADQDVSLAGLAPQKSLVIKTSGGSSNSLHEQQPGSSSSSLALSGGRQVLRSLSSIVRRKEQPPPLFRPEGRSNYIPRRKLRTGHPVQLLECREFFNSEAVFLDWLRIAVTMASVAVLLMGYSAMAFYNPLKRPAMHIAEIISLLLLPCSCLMVGYAMRVYIWRGNRLHSMRHRRVDDQVGPILMTLVFVTAMTAILLVNIADLYLLMKYRDKHSGDADDPVADL